MLEGKKVLITGHTGQIGHAVAQYWAPRCKLWGLARYSSPGSRGVAESMGLVPVVCDLTSGDFTGVPDDFDFVVHFAGNTSPATQDEGMEDNADATGLLLHHCRGAQAFLHVSTTGVYSRHPDHFHRYREGDRIGGATDYAPFYGGSKTAAEGVVRTLGRIYALPTTIARMDVAYGGPQDDGGLPGICLDSLAGGQPITIPASWPCLHMPIHEDDIARQVEPLLAAATIPSNVVNWGGDEVVSVEEFTDYLGTLTGLAPIYNRTDKDPMPQGALDNTRRIAQVGACKMNWREGMRRMVKARRPDLLIGVEDQ